MESKRFWKNHTTAKIGVPFPSKSRAAGPEVEKIKMNAMPKMIWKRLKMEDMKFLTKKKNSI